MTNIWMLSKDSMKGMDLLTVSSDVLYAIEQLTAEKSAAPEKELREKIKRGLSLLNLLTSTIEGQITKGHQIDLFMLRIVEALEKGMGLPPSKLTEILETGKAELKEGHVTPNTTELFEKISEVAMVTTSRSVEALSTLLR